MSVKYFFWKLVSVNENFWSKRRFWKFEERDRLKKVEMTLKNQLIDDDFWYSSKQEKENGDIEFVNLE